MKNEAVKDLIKRVVPEFSQKFFIRTIQEQAGTEEYAVYGEDNRIVIEGANPVVQAAAFYQYLKIYCHVNLSWCGNCTLQVEDCPVPVKPIKGTIYQKYRSYMNYCTFCYSAAVWDWERWEKEIDFMAMQGINMPLSIIGTDAVWYQTLLDLGMKEEDALEYLSSPAHWAWQLMTNIDSFLPPPDISYLKERLKLGRRILKRQKELGMMPVMQGFSGHIPKQLKNKYPEMKTLETSSWCGFPTTCQLDPLDPMFTKIGSRFLENQKNMLGYSRFLACDPFHENTPPSSLPEYLHQVGKVINDLYEDFSAESVWVMQSWSIYKDIAKSVPKDRLLVFDINGERYAETEGFWGHQFVVGDLHNFGGKNSLHGDIEKLADFSYTELQKSYEGLCGMGLFMEGINQNPIYYDMSFGKLIQEGREEFSSWLKDYGIRRYKRERREDFQALKKLKEACYAAGTSDCERGSVICARPDFHIQCAAPNDILEQRYDNRILLEVLDLLLSDESEISDGLLFDICDITRQLLSNYAQVLYGEVEKAATEYDKKLFTEKKEAFLALILDMDALLCTRKELCLSRWVSRAESLGNSEKMKQYYRESVLTLLTVWGPMDEPMIFDYAWREWGGLCREYYYKRWKLFLDEVETQFEAFPREHQADTKMAYNRCAFRAEPVYEKMADLELDFIKTYREKEEKAGETLSVAKSLIKKYRKEILIKSHGNTGNQKVKLDFWEK